MDRETASRELSRPLAAEHVRQREQAGRRLSYIEGWHAIGEANRIFGHFAWHRETVELRCVAEAARKIGKAGKDGWGVTYIARVRVVVDGIARDGCGAGHGIDVDLGLAHESALKEAETDAMKRALMTFGNPFGLALYDKEQREVERTPPFDPRGAAQRIEGGIARAANVDALAAFWKGEQDTLKAIRAADPAILDGLVKTMQDRKEVLMNDYKDVA